MEFAKVEVRFMDDSQRLQNVSVAYSTDGIRFTKHQNNPVIALRREENSSTMTREP